MSGAQVRTFLRDWQGVIAMALSPIVLGIAMAMARPVVQPIAAGVVSDSLAPVRRIQVNDSRRLDYLFCTDASDRGLIPETPQDCYRKYQFGDDR
jgi:hypothetical protein